MIVTGVSAADAAQIEALVHQYGIAYDSCDRDLILACFSDDAHLDYLNGQLVVTGLAAIGEQMFHFGPGRRSLPGAGRIACSDHRFRVDWLAGQPGGEVAGRVSAIVHMVTETAGQAVLAIRGVRYTDRYARTAAGWRIIRRRHEQLWESVAPARLFGEAGAGRGPDTAGGTGV